MADSQLQLGMCRGCSSFYGNVQYEGFCSQCFKARQGTLHPLSENATEIALEPKKVTKVSQTSRSFQGKPSTPQARNASSTVKSGQFTVQNSSQDSQADARISGDGKSQKKKILDMKIPRGITKKQFVTKLLNRIPSSQSGSADITSASSSKRYQDFKNLLCNPALKELGEPLQQFIKHITTCKCAIVGEYEVKVQEFYDLMWRKCCSHSYFRNKSEEDKVWFMEGVEKSVTIQLYAKTFSMPHSAERGRDWYTQRKVSLMWWIEPRHLDIILDLDRGDVTHEIELAKEELRRVDARRTPVDKLTCMRKCSQHVFSAIKASTDGPASADDFLPALIYLLLVTNPPQLHANLSYIERFGYPPRVTSGETGYQMTNFVGAVAFVERLSHENLNISEEEYNSKMGIGTEMTLLDHILAFDDPKRNSGILSEIETNMQAMKDLCSKQLLLQAESVQLVQEMREYEKGLREQVDNIISSKGARDMTYWGGVKLVGSHGNRLIQTEEEATEVPPPIPPKKRSQKN